MTTLNTNEIQPQSKIKSSKLNPHAGHRSRLRKIVFDSKLRGCTEVQILEYLLSFIIARKDTKPLAIDLLEKFGNLKNIFIAPEEDLITVNGVGNHTAQFLRTLPLIFEYYSENIVKMPPNNLTTPARVFNFCKEFFSNATTEKILLVITDSKGNSITQTQITLDNTEDVQTKFNYILNLLNVYKAKHFIIIHNHLAGDEKPSFRDNVTTRKLVFSTLTNGVKILDHVIVCKGKFYSYRASGELDSFEQEFRDFWESSPILKKK